jgi:hypothetical protein
VWNSRNNSGLSKLLLPSPHGSQNLGRYIRRMELELEMWDIPTVVSIVSACSQLVIYKHFTRGAHPFGKRRMSGSEAIATAVISNCGKSLHHLQFQGYYLPFDFPTLIPANCRRLPILSCTGSLLLSNQSPAAQIQLPELHTLNSEVKNGAVFAGTPS